jgi:hypothetical protein
VAAEQAARPGDKVKRRVMRTETCALELGFYCASCVCCAGQVALLFIQKVLLMPEWQTRVM